MPPCTRFVEDKKGRILIYDKTTDKVELFGCNCKMRVVFVSRNVFDRLRKKNAISRVQGMLPF